MVHFDFLLDRGKGTKIGFGANLETHELGAQPLVLRNQADFYARSTDFGESTEIDRNQQFLTLESELDGYTFFSITNRNDWSMNPNRVDLDMSSASAATSIIVQDQIEWSQEFRIESEQGSEFDWVLGTFYSDSEVEGQSTRWYVFEYPARPCQWQGFSTTALKKLLILLIAKILDFLLPIGKNITEVDSLLGGIRYDYYNKSLQQSKNVLMPALPGFFIPATNNTTSNIADNSFSTFSPTIQWNHEFNNHLSSLIRTTYTEKPGGFSAYTTDEPSFVYRRKDYVLRDKYSFRPLKILGSKSHSLY